MSILAVIGHVVDQVRLRLLVVKVLLSRAHVEEMAVVVLPCWIVIVLESLLVVSQRLLDVVEDMVG